jgi:hypothetical protein
MTKIVMTGQGVDREERRWWLWRGGRFNFRKRQGYLRLL